VVLPRLTWWKHRARQISFAIAFLPVVAAAAIWRRTVLRRATVVAVTGSVGKTTVKEGLVAILQRVGPTLALASGSNGRKGIPRLLLRGRSHHRFVVVEVGILKPGRMWRGALVVKPDVTIITHVTWQHSSNYRSLDEVAEQKAGPTEPSRQ
jgi:UDP-N-acetylmuramoyl-tripeptide--D-alanyl-D-alanine ligase